MSSPEIPNPYPSATGPAALLLERHGATLIGIAFSAIRHGLATGSLLAVEPSAYPWELAAKGASFVTLTRSGALRGCIGSITAHRPLVEDVPDNAFAAAFRDGRFEPLRREELEGLSLSISVLGTKEPVPCASAAELAAALRPGIDGLLLEGGGRRGLYLPSVWEQLPEAADFIRHLKIKAGIEADSWPPDLKAFRFTTETISSSAGAATE